jgi:hypothetical protein
MPKNTLYYSLIILKAENYSKIMAIDIDTCTCVFRLLSKIYSNFI